MFKIINAMIGNGDFLFDNCTILFKLVNTFDKIVVLVYLFFKLLNAIV